MALTKTQIKNALKQDVLSTVTTIGGKSYTGQLVQLEVEGGDEANPTFAIRTGKPGRPARVTKDTIESITAAEAVAA